MKTAIYIEDGVFQIVLTPETEFEKETLGRIPARKDIVVLRGSFYECQGGWVRQGLNDDSTIFVFREKDEQCQETSQGD